jgi:site-specific DNA recombinase
MPTAGIYARKSVLKEDSYSIDMQVERAKAYCSSRGWEFIIFIDEGYSGKDTDRPAFKNLMDSLDKIDYVVVYRLDRISRCLTDFLYLTEDFDAHNVGFQSINENFDTTSPMGRAMLMIMAVFAQLEREIIAERVRDNMVDRARMGLWNGGPIPIGFIRGTKIIDGKERSALISNPEAQERVCWIFKEYLDSSIRKICKKLNTQGVDTQKHGQWNTNYISRMLRNPIYCIADYDAFEYFSTLGVDMVCKKDEFDGESGLMYYNRRKPVKKTTIEREKDQWILAKGYHDGIIPGKLFVEVQKKLSQNQQSNFNQPGYGRKGLLVGLLRCGKCGSTMVYKDYNEASTWQYYSCSKARDGACEGQTIKAREAEKAVLDVIRDICLDSEFLKETAAKALAFSVADAKPLLQIIDRLRLSIAEIEKEQKELIIALGRKTLPINLIEVRIAELESTKKDINNEIDLTSREISDMAKVNLDIESVYGNLFHFNDVFEELCFDEKRVFLHSIIENINVNDEKLEVNLFFGSGDVISDSGIPVTHAQGLQLATRLKLAGYVQVACARAMVTILSSKG